MGVKGKLEGLLERQKGANWTGIDLHLHTPGVKTFKKPDGFNTASRDERERLAMAYVERLKQSGIKIVAITDYNGIRKEWFNPIYEIGHSNGITVFPGIELSISYGKGGLHVLIIFDENENLDGINSFILGLDDDPSRPLFYNDGNHREMQSTRAAGEVIKKIKERYKNCIIILPHPENDKGFLKCLSSEQAAEFLSEIYPDALEHISKGGIDKLISTGKITKEKLERFSYVKSSDSKSLEEISSGNFTYIKISDNSIDAIKLCLHDPKTRIKTGKLDIQPYDYFLGMEIQGSGFLKDMKIAWNSELNTLIGGRGAGKSAIIETLRYILDFSPYSEEDYRTDLVRYALGSGGKGIVYFKRVLPGGNSRIYRIERILDEEPRVFDEKSDKELGIPPKEVFGHEYLPLIFGQREIYAVSGQEDFLLRLLDNLIGAGVQEREKNLNYMLEKLRENGEEIIKKSRDVAKKEEYEQRYKNLQHEMNIYKEQGVVDKLNQERKVRTQTKELDIQRSILDKLKAEWINLKSSTVADLQGTIGRIETKDWYDQDLMEKVYKIFIDFRDKLVSVLEQGIDKIGDTLLALNGLRDDWSMKVKILEDELAGIKQTLKTDRLDPNRVLKVDEELNAIEPMIERINESEEMLRRLKTTRDEIIGELRDIRHELYQFRQRRADEINKRLHERLRIQVIYKGLKKHFLKSLGAILRGSGVSKDAISRIVEQGGIDGIFLSDHIKRGHKELMERFGLTDSMAEKIINWFSEKERLFELETLQTPDEVRIEMLIDNTWKPIHKLSPGQKCIALLLLLLEHKDRILIVDQPEDDLDNRFIYDDIVKILREQKMIRQILVCTHNANIPVIGDAELVLTLDAEAGQGKIICRGSIDNRKTREYIKAIMEGGEEALKRRWEKYGVEI
jgi:ABC-type Mn2+/Zn2+ transport system ATPase subunit